MNANANANHIQCKVKASRRFYFSETSFMLIGFTDVYNGFCPSSY